MEANTVRAAIAAHGAQAVYDAATRHMAGAKPDLCDMGLSPATLGDVYDALSSAYAELGEAARAIDAAKTSAALKRFEGQ